jgi:histidyl-tRNA synthetase
MSNKKAQQFQTLKGFKDILPPDQKYFDKIYEIAKKSSNDFGFEKIDTPILEDARIYIKGTGKGTDIVEKELYVFEDKGGSKVALRPEFTPGVLRSYLEHGMVGKPQPVRLFSFGPIFRHDNPQAGRFRQFNQANFEVIGTDSPDSDSQLISLAASFFKNLGINVEISVNSIGCPECRKNYIKQLKNYIKKEGAGVCTDCEERVKTNPLRVFDCKNKSCHKTLEEAPQIVDFLCEDCQNHFVKVLENLDELSVNYSLNPKLVRGLDYYTKTVFEIFLSEEQFEQIKETDREDRRKLALGGGGRYDGLMEILGGKQTSALGFACGVERVATLLKRLKIEIKDKDKVDVFIAQLGDEAKKKCMKLFDKMREDGIRVREAFAKNGLKNQLDIANKLDVKYTLILGQKEMIDGTIIIRDMDTGIQEMVVFEKVSEEIQKRLSGLDDVKIYKDKK